MVRQGRPSRWGEESQPRFGPWQCAELWYLHGGGKSIREIAERQGISESYCRKLVARGADSAARGKIPSMLVVQGRTPGICPHKRPLTPGQEVICLECSKSGFDHLDALQPWPRIPLDVKPPKKPLTKESGKAKRKRTRKSA